MNWGIIGLGHMAKNFTNSLKELDGSNLTGVSSRSLFKLLKFALKYKIKPSYLFSNYEKLLSSSKVENIYIGTLNNTHFELIKKCIDSNKNIMCEKPFTTNLGQALEIKKKLKNSKVFFLEGIAYRSHPQTHFVIDLISKNLIGKVLKIKSNFGFNSGYQNEKGRLLNKDLGGGAILDLGCYPISMSNLLACLGSKEKKSPLIKNIKGKMSLTGVEVEASAILEYENGITSEIEVSIIKNLKNITVITGSDGEIHILDPWIPKKENIIEIHKKGKIDKLRVSCKFDLFTNQIIIFQKLVKNKKLKSNFHTMDIDDSVDCMNLMMTWQNTIIDNENFKK